MGSHLTVLYDGWCPTCTRMARTAQRLDVLGRLAFASAWDPEVLDRFGIEPKRALQRLVCRSPSGRAYEGIDALIQIALRLPLLWPLVPLLALGRWSGLGGLLYDAFAAGRSIVPPGSR